MTQREEKEIKFVQNYISKHFGSMSEMMGVNYSAIIAFVYKAIDWAKKEAVKEAIEAWEDLAIDWGAWSNYDYKYATDYFSRCLKENLGIEDEEQDNG